MGKRIRAGGDPNELGPLEPNVVDHKFYARGVGDIAEAMVKGGSEKLKLISIAHRARG
jgi:hypothetical protein